jgi:hypothetical protein
VTIADADWRGSHHESVVNMAAGSPAPNSARLRRTFRANYVGPSVVGRVPYGGRSTSEPEMPEMAGDGRRSRLIHLRVITH